MSDMMDTTDGLYDGSYDGSTDGMSNIKVHTFGKSTQK